MSDDMFERRQAERRYALKFLDFEVISDRGEVTGRGLARTLNVSETGLRLETGFSGGGRFDFDGGDGNRGGVHRGGGYNRIG